MLETEQLLDVDSSQGTSSLLRSPAHSDLNSMSHADEINPLMTGDVGHTSMEELEKVKGQKNEDGKEQVQGDPEDGEEVMHDEPEDGREEMPDKPEDEKEKQDEPIIDSESYLIF